MWYKPYGRTGKNISVVSFGGMRFADSKDIEGSAATVLHAHSKGVNYFDTAPGYCGDRSEDIIGAAIKHLKRDSFYVSTKSSIADGGDMRRQMERSLKRLNVDKIDFFHIWCVMSKDVWRRRVEGGAVAAAVKAKQEGLVDHVVISSHMSGEDLEQVLADGPLEGVTLGYCAINFPYRDRAVSAAAESGLGVVTMNPLGGGLIPQNAERFSFIKAADDPSVVAAAIRFNVSDPRITSALVGFANKQHVDEAVAAVEDFRAYEPSHVEAVRTKVLKSFDGVCTGCGYCLPCPESINIPQMMDAYNMKLLGATDSDKAIRDRLKWHWDATPEAASVCSQCGACEQRCTQKLPIRERLKEIATVK